MIASALALLAGVGSAWANEPKALRVAVIGNSPPMSYVDANGQLTGFNVAFARALCDTMNTPCVWVPMALNEVIDQVADGRVDLAAVSLLVTPERQKKVLFTKPYYRSLTIWLGRPGAQPTDAGSLTAVVAGSAQDRYATAQGWRLVRVRSHQELPATLTSAQATAALVPMLTAIPLVQDTEMVKLGLKSTVLHDAALSGDVAVSVNPKLPELRDRLDAAILQIKRDGRFDRICSEHLPFKLQ